MAAEVVAAGRGVARPAATIGGLEIGGLEIGVRVAGRSAAAAVAMVAVIAVAAGGAMTRVDAPTAVSNVMIGHGEIVAPVIVVAADAMTRIVVRAIGVPVVTDVAAMAARAVGETTRIVGQAAGPIAMVAAAMGGMVGAIVRVGVVVMATGEGRVVTTVAIAVATIVAPTHR